MGITTRGIAKEEVSKEGWKKGKAKDRILFWNVA